MRGSSRPSLIVFLYVVGGSPPVMSTGFPAAHAVQHLARLDRVEHRQRFAVRDGREAECHVLQHLDQDAAEAEGDQLAEGRIGHRADQRFGRAGRQHLLNLDAVDLGVRLVAPRVRDNRVIGLARLIRRLHADDDAAGIRLVQDVGGDDLHHDREADLRRKLCSAVGRGRQGLPWQRDLIGIADNLGFRCSQRGAARSAHSGEDGPDGIRPCGCRSGIRVGARANAQGDRHDFLRGSVA